MITGTVYLFIGVLGGTVVTAILLFDFVHRYHRMMKDWRRAAKDWESIALRWRELYYGDRSTMNFEELNGPPIERDRQATRNH